MKKAFLLVTISLLVVTKAVFAQEYRIWVCDGNSKENYYINLAGEKIGTATYKKVWNYTSAGIALVIKKKPAVYTLIDKNGVEIEPEDYINPITKEWVHEIYSFRDEMILTKSWNYVGAFNSAGKMAIPEKYNELTEFGNNHAIGIIGKKYYLVDKENNTTLLPYKNIKDVKAFSEGLAPIRIAQHLGYIDTLGNIAIKPQFYSVGDFSGGLAWAKTDEGLVGYIDYTGKWVIEPIFLVGKDYDKESDRVLVKDLTGWTYANSKGETNTLGVDGYFYSFSEGISFTKHIDLLGLIDADGNTIIEPKFEVIKPFKNGYARVRSFGKWGIINKKGEWVIEPVYEEIGDVILID